MEKFIPEIKNKGACRNMWTVVYMAQSKEIAINLQNLLTNEGILVKLRPVSKDEEKNSVWNYSYFIRNQNVGQKVCNDVKNPSRLCAIFYNNNRNKK
jgi:hypothetical protein